MIDVKVLKTSSKLVYGWAMVNKIRGEDGELTPYLDTDNEYFPEEVSFKAFEEYMTGDRLVDNIHDEKPIGQIVFAFPMITEIADAFGLTEHLPQTGIIVGMRVDDPEILKKYESGEYTGFSIGALANFEDLE